jgi:hypothetical protein
MGGENPWTLGNRKLYIKTLPYFRRWSWYPLSDTSHRAYIAYFSYISYLSYISYYAAISYLSSIIELCYSYELSTKTEESQADIDNQVSDM